MMNNRHFLFVFLCLAIFLPLQGRASTVLLGDYEISTGNGQPGDLSVDGNFHLNGNLDSGTTVETTPRSAVSLGYGEAGSVYTMSLSATRDNVSFLWRENAGGTLQTKMKLGADNVLTIYANNGSPGIVLDPNNGGGGLVVNGQGLLTQAAAESLFMPAHPNNLVMGDDINLSNNGNPNSKSVAIGSNISLFGDNVSMALGTYLSDSGGDSFLFGYGISNYGPSSTLLGSGLSNYGYGASLFGANNENYGSGTSIFGTGNTAWYNAGASILFGYGVEAYGVGCVAGGVGAKASSYASIALGSYNVGTGNNETEWEESDSLFEIGNGSSSSARSNALTLFKNANLRTGGKAEFKGGVRVPPQGDLSMGSFTSGQNPADLNPTTGLKYPGE